jgi:hypothetical protein
MKACGGVNQSRLLLQSSTPGQLDFFPFLDGGEMPVDEHRIGEWPQMLGGLEFGRIRRQKQQMHMLRHSQTEAGMPPFLPCAATSVGSTWYAHVRARGRQNCRQVVARTGCL